MNTNYVHKIEVDLGLPYWKMNQSNLFDESLVTWIEAIELIDQIEFKVDDRNMHLSIDWGRSAEAIKEFVRYGKMLVKKDTKITANERQKISEEWFYNLDNNKFNICFSCKVVGEEKEPLEYVKRFLRLLYFSLNLAEPGSANLESAEIIIDNKQDQKIDKTERFPLNLLSEPFEVVEITINELCWPIIKRLPFEKVWKWLHYLDFGITLFANTNTQKALFALLNSAKVYALDEQFELGLIYLAHALEAIFDLPDSGITNALRDRIFLVHGSPQNNTRKIRKAITSFYDKRSEFVHGELKLINPIISPDTFPDNVIEQYEAPLWDTNGFATAILVSTFQKMIENDWTTLKFITSFVGE